MEAATDPHRTPPRRRRRKQPKKKRDHAYNAASATTISELPSHITDDILSRLPLKSIFNCKRVCSSFRNLTLEPHFPQLHLSRSPLTLILYRHSMYFKTTFFGFLPLDDSVAHLCRRRAAIKFKAQFEFPTNPLSPNEQCGNLPLPELFAVHSPLEEKCFHLGVVDNCLYICDARASHLPVNIWVMKDYGDIGSWTLEWIIRRPLPSRLDHNLKPVKTLEDGTVLMIVEEKILVSYNPASDTNAMAGPNLTFLTDIHWLPSLMNATVTGFDVIAGDVDSCKATDDQLVFRLVGMVICWRVMLG
ncbi:hypothetical protein Vadar_029263 [Vaccinium darrowii]|uniref:Uncharacterized protein n=1 Tax=Vaccinium darrowii TaxID=229202 RepID=A0ACB7XUV6_9ERIC|nr:hypothetical protein Vadar_029263 [Vaccinium darrowii]